MNKMKSPWVKDLTSFFENLGKPNVRSSVKKKGDSNNNPFFGDNNLYKTERKSERLEHNDLNSSRKVSSADNCFKVKEVRDMFEKLSSTDNVQKISIQEHSSNVFRTTRSKEYIPPAIKEDTEKCDVYSCAKTSAPTNESTPIRTSSSSEKKRSHTKTNSFTDRKGILRKTSSNYKSFTSESDVEKENDGVIIRMKNQEDYYDCRSKYKSLLPQAPLYQLLEKKHVRRSLFKRISTEKPIDTTNEIKGDEAIYMNSIVFPDSSILIKSDNISSHVYKGYQEGDSDSEELEPSGECDSNSEMKLSHLVSQGPQRIKWAETEEGQKIIRIKDLPSEIIKWQEAQFEVITSEASYYHSLEILVNKIYKSPVIVCQGEKKQVGSPANDTTESKEGHTVQPIMTALQKHHLFSNILEIHICSGELLKTLEARWRENPFIEDLSDIMIAFSKEKLRPYITYLRNQRYQTSTYNQLLTNPNFEQVIRTIENDSDCAMMNLSSFLLLPMQRLLRLKLLFTVIRHYIPPERSTRGCDAALASLETLIKECTDQKMLMEQKEAMMKICSRLVFREQTGVSIGNKPLLKEGELKICPCNNKASKLLNPRLIKRNSSRAQVYLFEDQLIIAKTRKLPLCFSSNDDREMVADICSRSDVKLELSRNCGSRVSAKSYIFKLVLTQGLKGCAEYLCEADSKEDFDEWQNVFSPSNLECEQFEFNEVLVAEDYTSVSNKELDLKRGQILTITKKINDTRAIATSGNKEGEIQLSRVQFVMTSHSNSQLIKEITQSITQKNMH